ncbi:MAG: glycosyltransferase family 2 protein [Eubacteriales bacterium]|nr:glycosyltransferase family 2 protein [Eubacteriales bacterium]
METKYQGEKIEVSLPKSRNFLCVIMPAYYEGIKIKDNLLYASSVISGFVKNYCIIAVNDGSTDLTLQGIKEASAEDKHISYVSYDQNHGKGYAICAGVHFADASYIGYLDSDMELDPIMFRSFLRTIQDEDADIAIGSKLHKQSKLNYPLCRRIMSFGYYVMLKTMFRLKLKDTQTGIKLFKASVLKPICKELTTPGFAFDIEILARASMQGCKIIEMPVRLNYNRDKMTKSKVSLKQVFNVFKDTMRIRRNLKHMK